MSKLVVIAEEDNRVTEEFSPREIERIRDTVEMPTVSLADSYRGQLLQAYEYLGEYGQHKGNCLWLVSKLDIWGVPRAHEDCTCGLFLILQRARGIR